METFKDRYHPISFSTEELELVTVTHDEIFFKEEDKYIKMVYADESHVIYTKNDEAIEGEEYEEAKDDDTEILNATRLVFLEQSKLCNLIIIFMPNHKVLPLIEVEFYTVSEKDNFNVPKWFGKQVSEKFFNMKTLWKLMSTQIEGSD